MQLGFVELSRFSQDDEFFLGAFLFCLNSAPFFSMVANIEFNFGGHEYNFTGVFCVEPRVGPPGVIYK